MRLDNITRNQIIAWKQKQWCHEVGVVVTAYNDGRYELYLLGKTSNTGSLVTYIRYLLDHMDTVLECYGGKRFQALASIREAGEGAKGRESDRLDSMGQCTFLLL